MHEHRRRLDFWKVGGAKLFRLAGRMQRIREQKQSVDQTRSFSRQHAGLAAAIGMASDPDSLVFLLAGFENLLTKAFAVARRITSTGRSMRAILSKRQVVTHHLDAGRAEGIGHG